MEDLNFTRDLGGAHLPGTWSSCEPEARSRWVFESADHDSAEVLYATWHHAVARSRAVLQTTLARRPELTQTYTPNGTDNRVSLRRLLVDMIEEYGRHTGQADLLREAIDGRVGEDPPGPAFPYHLSRPR